MGGSRGVGEAAPRGGALAAGAKGEGVARGEGVRVGMAAAAAGLGVALGGSESVAEVRRLALWPWEGSAAEEGGG